VQIGEQMNLFPYLDVSLKGDTYKIEGITKCQLGTKLPNGEGVYVEWFWDGSILTVSNDYSGYYPLYYYATSNKIMISNSIIKLISLGAPTELDLTALSVFCRCGFFLGNDTPFKMIRSLPPNAKLKWENGCLQIKEDRLCSGYKVVSSKDASEGYADLFQKAVEKYIPLVNRFVLPLSGGRDSRYLAFELLRHQCVPDFCVTCGDERDIIVAKQICQRIGIQHQALPLSERPTRSILRKNILTHFCTLEHDWLMVLRDYLLTKTRSIFEGTGVGILTRSELLTPELVTLYERSEYANIAEWIFNTVGPREAFIENLPGQYRFLYDNRTLAIEKLVDELKRYCNYANPLTAFNFWNWNRRGIALHPFGLHSRLENIYTPFLDKDLYSFVSSITPQLIFEQEPQTSAIRQTFPQYSDIPYYCDMEKRIRPAKPISRLLNFADRINITMKYCPNNIIPLLNIYRKRKAETERNQKMQQQVILFLSQLSYCANRKNARVILEQCEEIEKAKSLLRGGE
jgi:hypothetical protein